MKISITVGNLKVSSVGWLLHSKFSIFLLSISSYSYCANCVQIVYIINKEQKLKVIIKLRKLNCFRNNLIVENMIKIIGS